MTSDALQKMRERVEAATDGNWESQENPHGDGRIIWSDQWGVIAEVYSGHPDVANADFMASAHQDIPQLLDLVASQAAEIARLRGEAGRYRFLRDHKIREASLKMDGTRTFFMSGGWPALIGNTFDAAVDAAIAEANLHAVKEQPHD